MAPVKVTVGFAFPFLALYPSTLHPVKGISKKNSLNNASSLRLTRRQAWQMQETAPWVPPSPVFLLYFPSKGIQGKEVPRQLIPCGVNTSGKITLLS